MRATITPLLTVESPTFLMAEPRATVNSALGGLLGGGLFGGGLFGGGLLGGGLLGGGLPVGGGLPGGGLLVGGVPVGGSSVGAGPPPLPHAAKQLPTQMVRAPMPSFAKNSSRSMITLFKFPIKVKQS
jgi:hypothetical protein